MVPDTDSMDFKVGELLKDLQLDPLATKTIDRALSSIIDAINNIPDQEAGSEYAAGFLRDLRVPSDKVNFTFKSPAAIRIGGSYSIGCVAKPDINVDLLIRMPKDCFHEKDYLNHRYHAKRCIYLCVIEKSLRSSPLVRRIEWRTFRNQASKPVIHLYPAIKHADLSEFFIRIIPTASSVFNASRLRISRNNVRAFNHGDTSRATPYYNSSILEDMSIEENADFVKNTFNEWKTLGDALLLLKVWARNRTSIYTHDCLNGYLLSIILSYLSAGSGGNHINKSMKAMQIFRVTLKFMSSNQWEKCLSLQSLSKLKLSSEEMVECLQTFPVVLFDATGHTNLLFCLTRTAFAELQDETAWTVTCIDKCRGGGFEEVFMTKVDLAAKFDACLRINFKGNATVKSFDFCSDDERWGLVEKHVQSVLQQGLSDRAKLVRVNWRSAPSSWNINEGFEKFGEEPMLVGLLLSSDEKCVRVVDIGPHAENKEEADKFRKFWGERAELRRFRDGTIAESTVWECPPWQRHLIVKRITEYVIYKHFCLSQEDLLYVVDQLDFSLHLSGKDPISPSTSLMEAFETLSKRLRLLEIPLRISSVQPLDAAFRHTAVFPPEPHPLVYEKGIAKKIPKFTTTCIKPLTVMIQLEGSGNWPLDAKVIEKTKVAFLLKICESLRDQWGMLCSATEHEVNVLMGGYAFSLKILHERSLHLLRSNAVAGNDTIKGKRYIDEELFLRSQHSSMINGLNGRYPAYGSVVRLAKRWVSSHLFSSFFEEEAIELIVAYLFLRPFPFHAPLTRITGFLRFLRLISNYDWTFSPLIIDLNGDFTPQDEWEINENLLSSRKSSVDNVQNLEPAMFLATTYDKTSKAWTKFLPNGEILRRMDAYARSSADLLTKLILHGQNGPYTWECLFRTPMNNYDAVVVLRRDKLAYPQRLLFPSSTCHGKHVIQGKESKDFNPFIQFGDAVKSPEDARSKLLVNFDPTMFFLEDLKEEFPETFKIWYDALGGDTIGLTWDLKKRKRENYDGDEEELINKLKGVGEVGKGFVKSVYFLKAPKLQV